ncbi:MAG TPA: gluconate 2-dehydrogenase subunit 3 family protein [Gemmatimonadales bacterium]|nr:gluconate 2-dehydrogenase subunit 3 family protein [Gemmatimonadales bacterium]
MQRREALRALGGAAALPLISRDLFALGRQVHAAAGATRRVLDAHQDATVTAMADLIIPATDTPGAKDANVTAFIDVMLADWYDPEDRDRFLAGLADVDRRHQALFGKDLVDGTAAQQASVVAALDDEVTRLRDADQPYGKHPFHMLKRLTVIGYYTSEVGAEKETKYTIIPGRYGPCEPVAGPGGH